MPLRTPKRLPKQLNRRAGPLSHSIARRYVHTHAISRKRKRIMERSTRRLSKMGRAFLAEFRVWIVIVCIATIIGLLALLLFSPVLSVQHIQIRRQDPRIDIGDIEQTLAPLFKERLPFVSKAQVSSLLLSAYPDIQRVEIEKRYPSSLRVWLYVDPVVAALTLEEGTESQAAGTGSLDNLHMYITAKGYAVLSPLKLAKDPLPILTLTDWGVRPENRTYLLSPAFLSSIFSARDTLRESFGLPVHGIIVFVRAQEFHLQSGNISLWFDLISPLPIQFQRFREFLKTLTLHQVKEYIDLRIADRVVYQ